VSSRNNQGKGKRKGRVKWINLHADLLKGMTWRRWGGMFNGESNLYREQRTILKNSKDESLPKQLQVGQTHSRDRQQKERGGKMVH